MFIHTLSNPATISRPEPSFAPQQEKTKHAALIVAHPDDEVLWAGGFVLQQGSYHWYVLAVTRASDPDRAPRFYQVLNELAAEGKLEDLDDGPEQTPLPSISVQAAILSALPAREFDLVLTHGPRGEYTRHRRHEEVVVAVHALWRSRLLQARKVLLFAFEDGQGAYLPQPDPGAHLFAPLPEKIWQKKYHLITEVYGFDPGSWEARVTPSAEAFWSFNSPEALGEFITASHENDQEVGAE